MAAGKGIAVGLFLTVATAGVAADAAGVAEFHGPKAGDEWQSPIEVHTEKFGKSVVPKEEVLPVADSIRIRSTANQMKLLDNGMSCPDREDPSEVYIVGVGATAAALCLDTANITVEENAGITWIVASPVYPSQPGQIAVDLAATFENSATRDQCLDARKVLTIFLKHTIQRVDPEAFVTLDYPTQIVMDRVKPSSCDEPGFVPQPRNAS